MTKREVDINGYVTIRKNPISKVGVFPYLGKNIDPALEPNKIYFVYRPAEELCKPETIASFRNIPIIDDHTMLGIGATPAERKGVDGVTGDDVGMDGEVLYADLHLYSDTLKRKIDSNEKKELSIGYRVSRWEPSQGTYNSMPYDFIQRGLLGNHVAVVKEGRAGRDVAVQDHMITYDHLDIVEDTASDSTASPAAENKGDAEQPKKGANDMADEDKKKDEDKKDVKDEGKETKEKPGDETLDESDEDKEKKKKAMDKKAMDKKEDEDCMDEDAEQKKLDKKEAMDAAITGLRSEIADLRKNGLRSLMAELNQRNEIAKTVEAQFGTFDHAESTASEVAAYGLKKAGIEAPAGAEVAVWNAYSAGRKTNAGQVRHATDAAPKAPVGSLIASTLAASK